MPPFKGKHRLARFILKRLIESAHDVQISGKYGCTYTIPNLKETIGFEILINGIYEQDTIDFIISCLKPGKIFLDIGANIGAITIPVCHRRNDINAVCVEAASWLFEYLQTNVATNKLESSVKLVNRAISDVSKQHINFYSPKEKYGKGSLAPVFTQESVPVETVTLADIASEFGEGSIGLIKIDVEGFEYQAFLGGASLLKEPSSPDILFEFVDWAENLALDGKAGQAQALLLEFGYHIYQFEADIPKKRVLQPITKGDCMLFATKQRL